MENYANDTIKEAMIENEKSAKNPNVIITNNSLLNGINEKGLSKDSCVKIKNFPGGTTETFRRLKSWSRTRLIGYQAGSNDFTRGKNVLNNAEKLLNW